MKKYPRIITIDDTIKAIDDSPMYETKHGWYPMRPIHECSFSYRLKAAWLVFIGKADALRWFDE